jgi:hypothetical protein
MRLRPLALVVAAALSAPAYAIDLPGPGEPEMIDRYPVVGPYQLTGSGTTLDATTLYSNTTQTGSRFNPGTGGDPLGTGVQQDITFDDIAIPDARLGGATAVDVTRVTVGIRRGGTAPAVDLSLFWSTASTLVVAPDTELDVPFFPVATTPLAARSDTAFITELVSFGDGVNTLFTAPLNNTILNGYGTFLLGLQFSNGDSLNGWRLTSGADVNADVMWIYDTDVTDFEGSFNFGGAPSPAATFYVVVEGNPVPEPAGMSLLAGASILALRRRR